MKIPIAFRNMFYCIICSCFLNISNHPNNTLNQIVKQIFNFEIKKVQSKNKNLPSKLFKIRGFIILQS